MNKSYKWYSIYWTFTSKSFELNICDTEFQVIYLLDVCPTSSPRAYTLTLLSILPVTNSLWGRFNWEIMPGLTYPSVPQFVFKCFEIPLCLKIYIFYFLQCTLQCPFLIVSPCSRMCISNSVREFFHYLDRNTKTILIQMLCNSYFMSSDMIYKAC